MEITIDIGENTLHALDSIAKTKNKTRTISAVELLDLGINVFQAQLVNEKNKKDKKPYNIEKTVEQSNELLKEVLSSVFNRERSRIGAYDCESAILMTERLAEKVEK